MTAEILAICVYGLAMLYGCLWSKEQRYLAVREAYNQIRIEIRREHGVANC